MKALTTALTASALNSVPGVGGNLSINDLTGATRGIVLNPNAELLYDSPDLREIGMTFKMVPRNFDEAKEINNICKTFKMCTLPSRNPGKVFGMSNQGITAGFIGVPNLVKVSFMKGSGLPPVLPVYKMCALTEVDVNYTPDGSYATYEDGSMVAIELSVAFQESKLIFSSEVEQY